MHYTIRINRMDHWDLSSIWIKNRDIVTIRMKYSDQLGVTDDRRRLDVTYLLKTHIKGERSSICVVRKKK